MTTVSVVIPCFNQGQFLREAVASVLGQSFADFEIIVVDDGSTEERTIELLQNFAREKTRVIHTANHGLAAARNNGIAVAEGRYILPLDADDRIEATYLEKAVAVLDGDPEIGIVYCQARLFGAVDSDWDLPDYSLERMLVDNIIFCSACYRRDDWLAAGGYDPGMIYGWEDYEFWLSLIEKGRKVVRLPETLFYYRVASDSMVRSKEKWQKVEMFRRIYQRHRQLIGENIAVWIDAFLDARDRYYTSRLYVDCGRGLSDQSSVARKIESGTRRIVFDLSGYTGITALRFDPVDTWAVLALARVRVTYRTGMVIETTAIDSNARYSRHGVLLFDTGDPQCFFPELTGQALCGITQLAVDLHFVALAERALEYIVDYQRTELEKAGAEGVSNRIREAGRSLLRSFAGKKKGV
jgi:glycosyltransferase involved in cell wall biosynthesis